MCYISYRPPPVSIALSLPPPKNNEAPIKSRENMVPAMEAEKKIQLNDLSPRHLLMILMAAGVVTGDI